MQRFDKLKHPPACLHWTAGRFAQSIAMMNTSGASHPRWPQWTTSPGFQAFVWKPSPHWIKDVYMTNRIWWKWQLGPRLGRKGIAISASVSCIAHSKESQHHITKTLKKLCRKTHVERNGGLWPTVSTRLPFLWVSHLRVEPLVPASICLQPQQTLTTLQERPWASTSSWASPNPCPTEIRRNSQPLVWKLLHFGVICYVTINYCGHPTRVVGLMGASSTRQQSGYNSI